MCKTLKVHDNADLLELPAPAMADRPVCPGCEKPRIIIKKSDTQYTYEGYGFFCTLRCATDWANRLVRKRASATA
jgi:hypothetical protein